MTILSSRATLFIAGMAATIALGAASLASAQTLTGIVVASPACRVPSHYLYIGSRDATTGSDVSALQNFLSAQGYFSAQPTGYFGSITLAAVEKFQSAQGISAIGYVGPLTRAAIQRVGCVGGNPPSQSSLNIQSISPTSGAVGTTVSITGFGFTADNTVMMDGLVASKDAASSPGIAITCTNDPNCQGGIEETITFTVPSSLAPDCAANMACPMFLREVTAGTYPITVENSNGTSNAENFTVTGGTVIPPSNTAPTISGLNAPAQLSIGTMGTWTVNASSAANTGNLQYSVVWGDENAAPGLVANSSSPNVQTSATFTHVYNQAGTFTPTFTVTNSAGQSATVSASVVVTPLY